MKAESKDERIRQLERELDSAKQIGAEFKYLSLQLLKELETVTRERDTLLHRPVGGTWG
jgi:hypothetical protein